MAKYKLYLPFFIFLISSNLYQINTYPIFPTILAVSLPLINKEKSSFFDYSQSRLENSFFRWLQASGADVVLVHPWTSVNEINLLLETKVNGVLFQGNPLNIDTSSSYYSLIRLIYNKVIAINDNGTKLPLLVIGDDCSLLSAIIANDDTSVVTTLSEDNKVIHPSNLNFYLSLDKTIILKEFSQSYSQVFETKNILPNSLGKFISVINLIKNRYLSNFFKIIATSKDNDGQEYVSIAEGKKYPVIMITFHPEFIGFENGNELLVPESLESYYAARFIGNGFIFYGRKNNENQFTVEEKRKYDYIEPYGEFPKLIDGRFNYIFKNPN